MASINCIVETPKGSNVKYDYEPELACFELNKVLPAGLAFPFDFGFIPGTIGGDGDPLDVIIISEATAFPGCVIKCRIIGGLQASQRERDGKTMRNDRYIAIPDTSFLYKHIKEVNELPAEILNQLKSFFINYNEQAGKAFRPLAWIHTAKALKAINKSFRETSPSKLIQILLPLNNDKGDAFPEQYYKKIKKTLVRKFGGVTTYTQTPATGLWKKEKGKVINDKMIVYEVMASKLDRSFWEQYKKKLQDWFKQEKLVIRQTEIGTF
ncbi:inorganic diphosphatase [Taibaiella lutea]|uniref:inorganic diphosphatase n=1 Tax=Taibaiella lutea TaxID=2608001 RepID=A0A5M6CCY2_9BACT|nr:inorganic diphosphatase [Taibaiella lutea]KAA5532310.1 inorganic diphosphatase [Taibaiella lutea]